MKTMELDRKAIAEMYGVSITQITKLQALGLPVITRPNKWPSYDAAAVFEFMLHRAVVKDGIRASIVPTVTGCAAWLEANYPGSRIILPTGRVIQCGGQKQGIDELE